MTNHDIRVAIIGAGGYLGTEMVDIFLKKGFHVIAIDRFFFGDVFSKMRSNKHLDIVTADIRNFDSNLLHNVDVVINLASLSNDPTGDLNPKLTYEINELGAVYAAKEAKKMGVKQYIFASSCSVYGSSKSPSTEQSKLHPISVYAKSKARAEKKLLFLSSDQFIVTIFRCATLYGLSLRRMRFDLMINVMTLNAYKNGKNYIFGGGKQWRPLLHLKDCIDAYLRAIEYKDVRHLNKEIINVGSNDQNFQTETVAFAFKKHFPQVTIEVVPEDPDPRSYHVRFDKITKLLGFQPKWTIDDGIREIKEALEKNLVTDSLKTHTVQYYRKLMQSSVLQELDVNLNE